MTNQVRRDLTLVLAAITLAACDYSPEDDAPTGVVETPAVGALEQSLKVSTTQGGPGNYFFGVENGSRHIETASAIIPPGTNPACPNGRAIITMGDRVLWMDLDCLSNPAGTPGCHVGGPKSGEVSTATLVTNAFPQTVPTAPDSITRTCKSSTTARMYEQGGADSAVTRYGANGENLLLIFSGTRYMTRFVKEGSDTNESSDTPCAANVPIAPCARDQANNVNFVARSTNCGATWPTANVVKVVDNGDGQGNPSASAPNPDGMGRSCGNLDMQLTYRSPYSPSSGAKYIYAFGGTGGRCCGGVDTYAIYRSANDGATFDFKTTLNVGNPGNPDGAFATPFSAAFWPDGTVALFGCGKDLRPRAFWSRGTDDLVWNVIEGVGSMPDCRTLDAVDMPAQLRSGMPHFSSISRILDPSLDGSFRFARVVYSTVESNGSGGQRVALVRGTLKIPTTETAMPSLFHHDVMQGMAATNSIFRASFATDTYSPNGPDAAVLYWQEGQEGTTSDTSFTRYSVVTGIRNYTAPRNLSVNGTALRSWVPKFTIQTGWAGEFDRPSFYQVPAESSSITDTFHAFMQWTESHADVDSGYVHYGTAHVTNPRYTSFSLASSGLALKPGLAPAAVTVAASSPAGEKHIHVYAVDTANTIRRIRYSVNSGTWGAWTNTQGVTSGAVAAASWGTGRVDVFAVGQDANIWHWAEQNGVVQTCCPWENLASPTGGFAVASPGAASQAPNQLFVVGVRANGQVVYRTYKSGWSPSWASLAGGVVTGGVAAVSWAAGRIDVFGRNSGILWHYSADDDGSATWEGGGNWENLGAAPPTDLAAESLGFGKLDIFALDAEQQVQHRWYRSDGWSVWHTIGGVTGAAPGATSPASAQLAAFARGQNGSLYWSRRGF